jgi:hypothetical protein
MENKPKPSGTPKNSGPVALEGCISRQQVALAHTPTPEGVEEDARVEASALALPHGTVRVTVTETLRRTYEITHIHDIASSDERLLDLAREVLPELVEAKIIRPSEKQCPSEKQSSPTIPTDRPLAVVVRATSLVVALRRLGAQLFQIFKQLRAWLGF